MPFAVVERPSLALSVLKASLTQSGADCDICYPNLDFARLLGTDEYGHIATDFPLASLAGEWVFCASLYDDPPARLQSYPQDILGALPSSERELLQRAQSQAGEFIESLADSIVWDDYGVVGFTSSGDQNIAALALARQAKERNRDIVVVFGGPNWRGSMGEALLRRFPFVDAAFTGEADHVFPAFVAALDAGGPWPVDLPGVLVRPALETDRRFPATPVDHLDALPLPDFADYFAALSRAGLDAAKTVLQVEGSRGCSWGARHACRFCGMAGAHDAYRCKSPARLLSELRLAAAWPCARIELTDNVVSASFLDHVLPRLIDEPLGVPLCVEARAELTHEQVARLAAAGAIVQVGIESLSDHVLGLMRKGTRSLENIRLLKWCHEQGVGVSWNFLYDMPDEDDRDYDELKQVLPALKFLPPPGTCQPVQLERFSDLYDDQRAHRDGRSPGAAAAFGYIYPFGPEEIDEIAYASDMPLFARLPTASALRRYGLRSAVEEWRRYPRDAHVGTRADPDGTVVVDCRPDGSADGLVLDPLTDRLCRASEDIAAKEELLAVARASGEPAGSLTEAVNERLALLIEHRLMVTDGTRYLSLLQPSSRRRGDARVRPRRPDEGD